MAVNIHAVILGCLSMLVVPGISLYATAQPTWHNLDAGEYAVGFRLLQERDNTRVVAGSMDQARPVRMYLWYPGTASPGVPPMLFGRYAELANDDVWPIEIAGPLRQKLSFSRHALARSLGPEGFEALGKQPVRAFENAESLPGSFPLIVIGQGLYYESPVAFAALSEYLAGRGFVVATCPLSGTHTPLVKLDVEDLETQVRDLEFVIARAREFPQVSPDKLGVMGFDMGGMAGLILAMRNAGVDAFASVPAGILYPHPSGLPAASPDYDPLKLRVPWLHAAPRSDRAPGAPTASLFETAVHSERYHLQIDDLKHVDSTSYALVEGRNAMPGFWPAWEAGGVERHKILSRYVVAFFTAFLMNNPESLAFLRGPEQVMAASGLVLEYRLPTPPPITYAQFVDALLTGDAASAMDDVRDLRRTQPTHILRNDFYLYRLAYSLLYSWGLSDEAMELSKLNVELNPSSTLAAQGLSMSHVDRGDYAAAIEVYRRLLEMNPDDSNLRRTFEWLQGQQELAKQRQ
jgi:dienelactone hydrolase